MRPADEGYLHDVLVHEGDGDLAATAVPFLCGGLESGEVVLVLAGDRVRSLLMDLVPGHAQIQFRPAQVPHENPGRTAARFHQFFRENLALGATGFRVLGEISLGPDATLVPEWARYESVINEVFAPYRSWALCTVERAAASPDALRMVEGTHPHQLRAGVRHVNPGYADPTHFLPALATASDPDPLQLGPPTVDLPVLDAISDLRPEIRGAADVSGLPWQAADEFMLAVSEIAANALQHGVPPVSVRAWAAPGRVLCTVTDRGEGFEDPSAGFRSVYDGGAGRREAGLTLARQLCDQVHFGMTKAGFTVRLARTR